MNKYLSALFLTATIGAVWSPAYAVTLTSLTLEMSTDSGEWTNAAHGIWSTNTADPLTQLGVRMNGVFLNDLGPDSSLREINIQLSPGLNTFELFGTHLLSTASEYYGLSLFFDNHATPPDMAVYNANDSLGAFSITTAGTRIAGSANGGLFPDFAPGTATYLATNGSVVKLVDFIIRYHPDNEDLLSWGYIAPDGHADVYATLTLRYNPVPEPAGIVLVGSGLIGFFAARARRTARDQTRRKAVG